jgi:hypothetical protein
MSSVTLPPAANGVAGEPVVAAAVELMRVSVFEAKLLTQTDCPAGVTVGAAAPLFGGATRTGNPLFFPVCTSISVTVPSS